MKKLFKNSFMALAVLALGFSACTEEVEYTPAEVPATAQIYFSNTNGAQIDLAKEAKSFDIAVGRAIAGEAASIDVVVTADSLANTVFDFPATVEFADSAATAVYTVTVKEGVTLEYEVYHNIVLAFDETLTTPYGNGSYSFKVGVPAPWSEWEEVGKATYYYPVVFGEELENVVVNYSEYLLNDTDAKFYFTCYNEDETAGPIGEEIGMLYGYPFTLNYNKETGECQVPVQQVAVHSSYGPMFVCDLPNYPLQEGLTYEDFPCTYDAENGKFSLNLIYFVATELGSTDNGQFGYGEETIQLDGYYVPDYSFNMEYRGNYVDNNGTNNAVISTTKGADVAKYLMTVISADDDANAAIQGMLKGEVACDTLTEGGFYAYPITASGNYKALAITFDAEENPLEAHSTDFEFWLAGDSNPWQSLGYAVYTDDIILPLYGNPAMSYYVEVLENKEQPGLFRLMDLCGPEYPFYSYGTYKEGSYIEIDATDPEAVWIEGWQSTGFDLGGGVIEITSMAWYQANENGATKEDAKEAGLCGIYADGVITFPADGILAAIGDKAYYANRNAAFALDMTNLIESLPEEAAAARSAAARANVELKAEAMGKVTRFKKIDNSFMTIKGIEIK